MSKVSATSVPRREPWVTSTLAPAGVDVAPGDGLDTGMVAVGRGVVCGVAGVAGVAGGGVAGDVGAVTAAVGLGEGIHGVGPGVGEGSVVGDASAEAVAVPDAGVDDIGAVGEGEGDPIGIASVSIARPASVTARSQLI